MRILKTLVLFLVLCCGATLIAAQGLNPPANQTRDQWEEINFEFNSAVLSDGYPSLLRLAELLHAHPDYRVTLEGNTDSVGSRRYNDKLSRARAETVKNFLVKYGAAESQISILAHGKDSPEVSNQTKEGRFVNRRVVVIAKDGQGNTISAGGIGQAIQAIQRQQPAATTTCCEDILKRLDKLDQILAAVQDLKAENDKLKQDIAALQQAQQGTQKQVEALPKPPESAELQRMMTETANTAIDKAKPSRFSLLGVNIGPSLNSVELPDFLLSEPHNRKVSSIGNITFTGKARYFAPFGRSETHAFQAEGEYMYYHDRQEGQFDVGLVNRWSNLQMGLFNSMKHVHIADLRAGGTMGQGALAVDWLFSRGRIGFFGTKAYLTDRVIARTPFQNAQGFTSFNVWDETYLRVVDQVGASTELGLWDNAYLDANLGALFRRGGTNRPGGMLRLVQPINSAWAFTVEAGLNETMVGPKSTGRIAVGLQLGNWLRPKEFTQVKHPVPVDVPRVRYEVLTRRVRTGNAPPVADAGPDQIGVAAGTITLDGSGSYDPEGDPITYQWSQLAGPAVSLSNTTAAVTTFTAAAGQTYAFRLLVKDSLGAQSTAKVNVTTQAAPQVRIVRFTANPSTITSGQTTVLAWQVENAETVTISPGLGQVNAQAGTATVAPTQTTSYQLTARNKTSEVSETITVTVNTPQLTVADFQANPASIAPGQSSTLFWQTQNADTVTISGIGTVSQSGSTAVSPTQTTTYTLTASNRFGQATASVTVTVTPQTAGPTVVSFAANPTQILAGTQSTLSWQVQNATKVSISGLGDVNASGSQAVSPTQTTTYTLTATNAGGQNTATATVTVVQPAKITSFTATPSSLAAGGGMVTLAWTTTNATTAAISGIGPVTTSGSVQVPVTATTTYTLTAQGALGTQDSAQVQVTVGSTPPTTGTPIVVVGPDFLTLVRQVPLNAGQSRDPNGLPLTFQWTTSSNAVIINPASPAPVVQLGPAYGPYTFTVTVTNSAGRSSSASITVTLVPSSGDVRPQSRPGAGKPSGSTRPSPRPRR